MRRISNAESERWLWRIADQTESRAFRRYAGRIDGMSLSADERRLLKGLLAVEMTARPLVLRLVEWMAAGVLTALGPAFPQARRRLQRLTVGPLQVPFCGVRFRRHAEAAAARMATAHDWSTVAVARAYHGAATRQPGSAVAYAEALHSALSALA